MLQPSSQLSHENNVDKMQYVYKSRKLSLDAAEVFQLRYKEEIGPIIIASRPGYQWVSACHVLGKQTAGVVTGNAGIVLAIAKPAGGNYAFSKFLTAAELGAS
jgi:hypothetical protein